MTTLDASASILPDTLVDLWDDELKELFGRLNFKQQTFTLEYLACGVAAEAVEKAYGLQGPSAWTRGSTLLRDVNVRAFITAYRAKDIHRHEDDKELIRSTYRNAIRAETVVYVPKDDEKEPIKVIDHGTRIKAAQALAKLDGHNAAEKVEVDVTKEIRDFVGSIMAGK